MKRGLPAWQWIRIGISNSRSLSNCLNKMVSSRDGFLLTDRAAVGRGRAGVECSATVILKTSGEDRRGRRGGGEYNESRVE